MALPIRTTVEDILKICRYLSTKPTGATNAEATRVLGANAMDHRKISALKQWNFIVEDGGRLRLSEPGRNAIKNNGERLAQQFQHVIRETEAYRAAIERAVHAGETSISATEIAAYWHDNFPDEVLSSDRGINDQAVCFFQVAQGAELGTLIVGRKSAPTRIDFNRGAIEAFVEGDNGQERLTEDEDSNSTSESRLAEEIVTPAAEVVLSSAAKQAEKERTGVERVFITHGQNKKIVEQLKELVTFGKLTPVIAEEHETLSKPIPDKVMDDMRSCDAAIIHVASEQVLLDEEGKPHHKINENVLIEIGAAMALYKHNGRYNFILLVERGVQLPSNLQGLYECRYEGDKLDMEATMKLLRAFNEFSVT
jgi:predicted nucleotide-binding protein